MIQILGTVLFTNLFYTMPSYFGAVQKRPDARRARTVSRGLLYIRWAVRFAAQPRFYRDRSVLCKTLRLLPARNM